MLSRAQLLEHVWGRGYTGQSQVVETYVSYLRRKLHRLGPSLIHTRRGAGYLLCAPEIGTPGAGAPDLGLPGQDIPDLGAPDLGAAPEPAVWAMMLTGFALAGAVIRRRGHTPGPRTP